MDGANRCNGEELQREVAVRNGVDRIAGRLAEAEGVLRQALKTAPTGGFNINTLNTSITELELVRPNRWALRRYGDTAHLHGLPVATNVD